MYLSNMRDFGFLRICKALTVIVREILKRRVTQLGMDQTLLAPHSRTSHLIKDPH